MGVTAVVVGTAIYGAYQQHKAGQAEKKVGQAQQAAAEDQAQLDLFNAKVADLQAQDAIDRGAIEEQRFRTQVRGMIGAQRAAAAGGNIDVNYGSAIDTQADAAQLGELDALQIKSNAARAAWGFKVQAADLRRQAVITRKGGQYAAAAGREAASQADYAAFGTLLGTGTSLIQQKYGAQGSKKKTANASISR